MPFSSMPTSSASDRPPDPGSAERWHLESAAEHWSDRLVRLLMRGAWLALAGLNIAYAVTQLPIRFTALRTTCTGEPCLDGQLSPEHAQAFQRVGVSLTTYTGFSIAIEVAAALFFVGFSAFLFWRPLTNRVPQLFALLLLLFISAEPAMQERLHPFWQFTLELFGALTVLSVLTVLYIFPSGRFVPGWTRLLAAAMWLFVGLGLIIPGSALDMNAWPAPLQLPVITLFVGAPLVAGIYRYWWVSRPMERQQTRIVLLALTVAIMVVIVTNQLPLLIPVLDEPGSLLALANDTLRFLTVLFVPVAVGLAIVRYQLFGIQLLINRALVYGLLTAIVIAVYVLTVSGIGIVFRLSGDGGLAVPLAATGIVAVLLQPLRNYLQRGVNRLMYGQRDEPYAVLARLGQRLEGTLEPEAVLPTVVETVRGALKLPYAAIALNQNGKVSIAAASGMPTHDVVHVPLTYQNDSLGELLLAPRDRGESFSAADRRLLDDVARQIGVAAQAVLLHARATRLAADLQQSRERLVAAREEERRRLRRDLHDGLGPQLASLTLRLETARDRLAHEPLATELLSDLIVRTQDAVADIRRLVYGLRPPALDDLGLISALRESTAGYGYQGHDHVRIDVDAPEALPPLPAAVEVAAYRIVQEALTNVVRHANARHCVVRLTLDDVAQRVSVEVTDDGCGLAPNLRPGVGMTSMYERAEELGGSLTITVIPPGGTCVHATLPCTMSPDPARGGRA